MRWEDWAHQQAGAVARRQMRETLTEREIDGLVVRRDVDEVLPSVYSPRSVPDSRRRRQWAAVLWSGGVLSHHSAADPWGVPAPPCDDVHVTVADRRYRKPQPGVVVHRVPIEPRHVTTADGLVITGRVRTVVDLLRVVRPWEATTLADRAIQQGWLQARDIREAILSGRCRTGNSQLRIVLSGLEPGIEAESERVLHRLLRTAGIPGWVPQYVIALPTRTVRADVALPARRIVIEVDGRAAHDASSERFDEDRMRDNELLNAGWRVLRFTWAHLRDRPHWVLAQIMQLSAA